MIANQWTNLWHYKIGINIFPLDKDKTTYENWSKYKTEAITDEIHEEWKRKGRYAKGIILMPGKVWRGENKGLYFVGIDFDKELGIKEFCNVIGANTSSIDELKQKFIVEQHANDHYSLHVYFYSEIPFTDKSPDTVLGIEIKSNNKGLMCATPSYHSGTNSNWKIIGTDSPVILNSEEASKLMADIDKLCSKHNIPYLKNGKDVFSSSSNLTPLIRQMITDLEIIPEIVIQEGERHGTLISIANSLLIKYNNNVNKESLKNFFYDINNKLCKPTPLPESEIESIWRDAIKFSEDKTAGIQIVNDDENDTQNYRSLIVVPLVKGDKLLEKEFVQNLVYDTQAESIDCSLNTKYKDNPRIMVPINIKQWPDVRKTFRKLCEEKAIEEDDIILLLETLDHNYDLIKKHYFENHRKSNAALVVAAEQRKRLRLELIMDGTEFLLAKDRFATIEKVNDILVYNREKGVYEYGGEVLIGKELEKKYGYQVTTGIVNEIKDHIIRKTGITKDKFDSDLDIINVKNGLLNMKTGERLPHSPDYLSLNQLPIRYNPEAKAPKFDKFLSEVFYPEQIRTAKEIIAYTFIRKNIFQYWFVLIGNGGNGKNVFIGIVSRLHGLKNISNIGSVKLSSKIYSYGCPILIYYEY